MRKIWNKINDRWAYELEPHDIHFEGNPSVEDPSLTLVINARDYEAVYRVIVERR